MAANGTNDSVELWLKLAENYNSTHSDSDFYKINNFDFSEITDKW